ncbi:MAG: acetyl-CoA carboxylase biotin carboxyl carrier protein [Candidatus Saganbacteria bacterium]|uniref:Biotin carboxyl carrier protein of acetyl-CoA carboxylase n=1 Tax=Candidatus Saganbacteria bacterium TaxID=2575572 RepID=A0A833P3G6_UNCSA|nr:MAG: acetyl-CoA carboxylase biotin carboxyl carrier protein [Candidatus Saganbacteria bacterium]
MANFELLKKLIEMVKKEDVSGLSIEENGVKYEVKRERGIIQNIKNEEIGEEIKFQRPAGKDDDGMVAITSPMVGTFYRSPSPDSAPFVEAGDNVNPGKVVCIIEAMKLFNEIESEISGKIIKILVENGKTVEYGQKLMLVKKE